jgi:hypothetical protein
MNNITLLALIIVIATVSIFGVSIFNLGVFEETTPFKTKFIDGVIQGQAIEHPNSGTYEVQNYSTYYLDYSNGIIYYFEIMKLLNQKHSLFFENYDKWMGSKKVSDYEYNGTRWEVYYWDTKSNSKFYNETTNFSGYFITADKDGNSYNIVVESDMISSNDSIDSELFQNYVKPLIESLNFKKISNVPSAHHYWGLTEEEFDNMIDFGNNEGFDSFYSRVYTEIFNNL